MEEMISNPEHQCRNPNCKAPMPLPKSWGIHCASCGYRQPSLDELKRRIPETFPPPSAAFRQNLAVVVCEIYSCSNSRTAYARSEAGERFLINSVTIGIDVDHLKVGDHLLIDVTPRYFAHRGKMASQ